MARTVAQAQGRGRATAASSRGGSRGRGHGQSAAAKAKSRAQGPRGGRGRGVQVQPEPPPRTVTVRLVRKQPPPLAVNRTGKAARQEVGDGAAKPKDYKDLDDVNPFVDMPTDMPWHHTAGCAPRTPQVPSGHYDVLQLPRSANAVEIREAFRRRALATHPDKGGRSEEFQTVVAAFEVLSDGSRRLEYDTFLEASSNPDGVQFTAASSDGGAGQYAPRDSFMQNMDIRRVMRDALRTLMGGVSQNQQNRILTGLTNRVLHAMAQWLGKASLPREAFQNAAAGDDRKRGTEPAMAGLFKDPQGRYEVYISWAGLKLRTMKSWSLAEAIDWHITLTQLKATANARIRTMDGRMDPNEKDYDLKVPALTEEELTLGYQASPTLRMMFSGQIGSGKNRFVTPATPDLALALQIKAKWKKCIVSMREYGTSVPKEKIDALKKESSKLTAKEKSDREHLETALLAVINKELQKRRPGGTTGAKAQQTPRPVVTRATREAVRQAQQRQQANIQQTSKGVAWREEALLALEWRDSLSLNHADTVQAVETLKCTDSEHLAMARAVARGQPAITFEAQSSPTTPPAALIVGTGKRRRTSQTSQGGTGARASAPPGVRSPSVADAPSGALEVMPGRSGAEIEGLCPLLPGRRPQGDAALRATLLSATLRDWGALRACCPAVRLVVDDQAARSFKDFVYNDNLFHWESRSVYTGRARPTPHQRLALRLTRFLASPHHSALFAHVDLGMAPMEALQDSKLQQAMSKMRNLENVVFPNHGWATGAERQRFLSSLPSGASAWGRGRT